MTLKIIWEPSWEKSFYLPATGGTATKGPGICGTATGGTKTGGTSPRSWFLYKPQGLSLSQKNSLPIFWLLKLILLSNASTASDSKKQNQKLQFWLENFLSKLTSLKAFRVFRSNRKSNCKYDYGQEYCSLQHCSNDNFSIKINHKISTASVLFSKYNCSTEAIEAREFSLNTFMLHQK